MPYSLKSRNVLVVAGSRGLGAVIARKFAEEGANVAIGYVSNKERAEQAVKECEKHGVKTAIIQGDGGNWADCERWVQETKKAFGGVDVIVNNAVSLTLDVAGIRNLHVGCRWSAGSSWTMYKLSKLSASFASNLDIQSKALYCSRGAQSISTPSGCLQQSTDRYV